MLTKQISEQPLLIKKFNIAIFDNLDLRQCLVEIGGQKHHRDSALINYEKNNYIQQYKGLKMFFHEYIGEPLLQPLISYTDM